MEGGPGKGEGKKRERARLNPSEIFPVGQPVDLAENPRNDKAPKQPSAIIGDRLHDGGNLINWPRGGEREVEVGSRGFSSTWLQVTFSPSRLFPSALSLAALFGFLSPLLRLHRLPSGPLTVPDRHTIGHHLVRRRFYRSSTVQVYRRQEMTMAQSCGSWTRWI